MKSRKRGFKGIQQSANMKLIVSVLKYCVSDTSKVYHDQNFEEFMVSGICEYKRLEKNYFCTR